MLPDDLADGPAAPPQEDLVGGSSEDAGAVAPPGRRAVCKKGHDPSRMQRYGNAWACLECRNDNRKAREKGEVPTRPGGSKPEKMSTSTQIAAFAGAGLSPEAIAERLGMKKDSVEQVLRKDVKHDEHLQRVLNEARGQLAQQSIAVARKAIEQMNAGLDGYKVLGPEGELVKVDCPPQHAAVVLRELRPVLGYGEPATGGGQGAAPVPGLQINSPEMLLAMMKALRDHKEEQKQQAIEIQGERVG